MDGCVSDTFRKTINVGAIPVSAFSVSDTCEFTSPTITDQSSSGFGMINQWQWILDGNNFSTSPQPILPSNLSPGNHVLKLVVNTIYGCISDTASHSFLIRPSPVVTFPPVNGCNGQPMQ